MRTPPSCCYCCSVAKPCLTLCDPTDGSAPGSSVLQRLPKLAQTQVHRVGDTIQPSHPLPPPSPLAFRLSQQQGLFQWVTSLHHMAKVLELQLQHQSLQWIFRTDILQDGLIDLFAVQGTLYTMEYYSAIKENTFESGLMRWMKLEPIIQSEISLKEKHQYCILTHMHIYRI